MIAIAAVVAVASITGIGILGSKASKPTHSQSIEDKLSREARAGFRRADAALKAGQLETELSMDFDTDCTRHSEGKIRDYFQSHPCKRMARAYIQIGDIHRDLILVAISWVEMPSATSAKEYMQLVDTDAGNVIELSRETKPFKNITFEDRTYISGIKEIFVWHVEVKPTFSTTPDSVINDILARSRQQ
ncbi:hypothetical protein GCM10010191_27540 [Actinomadura vinacea]|uniref:Uncharacterized protein n=1 Tax=Actinomadura vinacea TaxID=115336 RepID=A0ABN3IW77_9ACTN